MGLLRLRALRDLPVTLLSGVACGPFVANWSGPRAADHLAFLPAELELVETPVHLAPRWTMRVLMLLALLILLIGLVGRLDIVVTASGRLIPDARVKVIQPAMTSVVRETLVRDGQRVTPGQLLMKLDTTQAAAEADKARSMLLDAQLGAARANALLEAQKQNRAPVVLPVESAPDARMQDAQHFAESAWLEYRDHYDSAQAELLKRKAELDSARPDRKARRHRAARPRACGCLRGASRRQIICRAKRLPR